MNIFRNMVISSLVLALFAIIGTLFVTFTYEQTIDQIRENTRLEMLRAFHVLIPPEQHDNDVFNDIKQVHNKDLLGSKDAVNIYRVRKSGKPVGVIINSVAPDGYNGNIHLLVAIYYNGTLAGVRVVQHLETPGLGDAIDEQRSDWITRFSGKSLNNPDKKGWAVKRDGGQFDQFTGATITPRAVVKAVYNTLRYYQQYRDTLYE